MKRLRQISFFLVVIAIIYSCNKSTDSMKPVILGEIQDHIVTIDQAEKIAELHSIFGHQVGDFKRMDALKDIDKNRKQIDKSLSVTYSGAEPTFHIINYENGGFVIVSGDDRMEPILAFSDQGQFLVDSGTYLPSGLAYWLSSTDSLIRDIRLSNTEPSITVKSAWADVTVQSMLTTMSADDDIDIELPGTCVDGQTVMTVKQRGPFLNTEWGQGVGFNNALSNMGCTLYANGRPPAGCVAIATAQIMRYHEQPSSYAWSSMPDNVGGTITSNMIKDVATAVSTSYGCDGSSAQTSDAASALTGTFGFSSATHNPNYNYYTIRPNLMTRKPVILSGGRKDKWWFFNVYADGHAWVADGIRATTTYLCVEFDYPGADPVWVPQYSQNMLHMNWGWSGSYNGWYYSFNPGSNTFNYKPGMIYNILP